MISKADTRPVFPAAYDADDTCIGCGEHIANPCDPTCPRQVIESAADAGARVMTAAEILTAGAECESLWWVIAEHMRNRWIVPGLYLATVAHDGRSLAPFSFGEHRTPEDAAVQVRGNLRFYAHGWVVTTLGAYEITAG